MPQPSTLSRRGHAATTPPSTTLAAAKSERREGFYRNFEPPFSHQYDSPPKITVSDTNCQVPDGIDMLEDLKLQHSLDKLRFYHDRSGSGRNCLAYRYPELGFRCIEYILSILLKANRNSRNEMPGAAGFMNLQQSPTCTRVNNLVYICSNLTPMASWC